MDWECDCSQITFPYFTSVTTSSGKSNWNIKACFCSPNLWKFQASAEMGSDRTCHWFWSLSLPLAIVSFQQFHVAWNLLVLCPSVPKPSWVGIQIVFGSSNKGLCCCCSEVDSAAPLGSEQGCILLSVQRRKTEAVWQQLLLEFV